MEYNLEGELLGTPYSQGLDVPRELADKFAIQPGTASDFCKSDYPLFEDRCETWTGILFVNLDPEAIDLPTFPGLNDTESQSAYFVHLFPNLSLWFFPHHLVMLLFHHQGVSRTLESVDMLAHPDALRQPQIEQSLDRIMEFWWYVNERATTAVVACVTALKNPSNASRTC